MKLKLTILGIILCVGLGYFYLRFPSSSEKNSLSPPQKTSQQNPSLTESRSPEARNHLTSGRRSTNLKNWDLRNPQDAITYHWDIQDYEASANIFAIWLEKETEAAFDFLAALEPPLIPSHFAPAAQTYLETLEPEQALALVAKLQGQPEVQESISANSFAQWTETNLEAALNWLRQQEQTSWKLTLAHRNGRTGKFGNPEKALEWMLKETDTTLASKLVSGVLQHWLISDTDAATAYLNRAEASPAYDEAIVYFVENLLLQDQAVALSWAKSIENEALRKTVVTHIENKS